MALPKSIQRAIAARKKSRMKTVGRKEPVRVRYSEARDAYYVPIKERSTKGKKAASKYDRMACSAGATAALLRGYGVSLQKTCGPRRMGASRSHRLLALWKAMMAGNVSSARAYAKSNPKGKREDGDLAFVYSPNPEKGKSIEWGVIEPATGSVLMTGTASNPESAYKAAHRKSREALERGAKRNPDDGPWAPPFDLSPSGKVKQARPKRNTGKKKNPGKKAKKNPGKKALRDLMRGT